MSGGRPPHGGMFSRYRATYTARTRPPLIPLEVYLAARRLAGYPVPTPPPPRPPSRYGPHDEGTAPDSVVVLGAGKWPHPEVRPLSVAVRRQRQALNTAAAR